MNNINSGKYAGGKITGPNILWQKQVFHITREYVERVDVLDKNSKTGFSAVNVGAIGFGSAQSKAQTYMINIVWKDGQASNATVDQNVFNMVMAAAVSDKEVKHRSAFSCSGMLGALVFLIVFIIVMCVACSIMTGK